MTTDSKDDDTNTIRNNDNDTGVAPAGSRLRPPPIQFVAAYLRQLRTHPNMNDIEYDSIMHMHFNCSGTTVTAEEEDTDAADDYYSDSDSSTLDIDSLAANIDGVIDINEEEGEEEEQKNTIIKNRILARLRQKSDEEADRILINGSRSRHSSFFEQTAEVNSSNINNSMNETVKVMIDWILDNEDNDRMLLMNKTIIASRSTNSNTIIVDKDDTISTTNQQCSASSMMPLLSASKEESKHQSVDSTQKQLLTKQEQEQEGETPASAPAAAMSSATMVLQHQRKKKRRHMYHNDPDDENNDDNTNLSIDCNNSNSSCGIHDGAMIASPSPAEIMVAHEEQQQRKKKQQRRTLQTTVEDDNTTY